MSSDRTHHHAHERRAIPPAVQHGLAEDVGSGARRSDTGVAFFDDPCGATDDDLAELLAEGFIASATSGEEVGEDVRNELTVEDLGGAFVEDDDAADADDE